MGVAMLRFMTNLVGSEEELPPNVPERAVLITLLPGLCAAICQCLSTNRHLLDQEEDGLAVTADFLLRAEGAFPREFPGALGVGLAQAQVSSWGGAQLQSHLSKRSEMKRGDWLDDLAHLVREWQFERRKVSHADE